MKKQAVLTFIIAIIALSGTAQKLPDWIINKPTPTNNTYLYVVESATGQTELQARNRAIAEVFRSTAMRIGQPIDSKEINRALQSGTEYYVIASQYDIPINKVCEYTDNKTSPCRVYVLCQVAKAGNIHVEFDDFTSCYESANTYIADEALYADGFTVSKNGRTLSDHEIRTMFANSNSYSLYDEGKRIENMDFSTVDGLANWLGGISITAGTALSAWWIVALVNQSAANDAKVEMEISFAEYQLNHGWSYGYSWDGYKEYVLRQEMIYEEKTRQVEKNKKLAKPGVWLIGGGIALIVAENLMEKALFSSGKTKIRKAVNLYNNGKMYSQTDLELNYGITPNGICLTLQF